MNPSLDSRNTPLAGARLFVCALVSIFLAACQPGAKQEVKVDDAVSDWELVQAYVNTDIAWHERENEIRGLELSDEEKERLREETRGAHPDIALSAAAATRILEAGLSRSFEAAEFLVEHTSASPRREELVAVGMEALADHLGPDWSQVEGYLDAIKEWEDSRSAIDESEVSDEEKRRLRDELGSRPKMMHAVAVATAIMNSEDVHEQRLEAAEFLLEKAVHAPNANSHVLKAANALSTHFPHYDNWPRMLRQMARMLSPSEEIQDFILTMSEDAEDPLVRATARYFASSGLIPKINDRSTSEQDRDSLRQQALDLATGLSLGIEDAEFVLERGGAGEGEPNPMTLAEAEAELLATIQTTTVGSRLPDIRARRLDGEEEDFSAYAGEVVLVDFWATWCGPCVEALPKLRTLAEDMPAGEFEILSVSVDDDVETVREFQVDEPMPWANWHVGTGSDMVRAWQVKGFPTYVLVDKQGLIISRGYQLDDELLSLIKQSVM